MRFFAIAAIAASFLASWTGAAKATGTAVIQRRDGSIKVYKGVRIRIRDEEMALTSSDGVGTLVIGKAACSKVSALIRCLPFDATLYQNGEKLHFELASGTVWLNPTTTEQPLSYTSAHIPPRGVLMAVSTKNGQTVSLTGTVDEVAK